MLHVMCLAVYLFILNICFVCNKMEAVLSWFCSFVADKVRVKQHRRTVTCGDRVLLCSIHLTNPKSKFTNYHQNAITISYLSKNTEAVQDCKFHISEVNNSQQLDVYCYLCRAGNAIVKLNLGKWYLFEDENIFKPKELSIRVDPDLSDVQWKLVDVKETAFRREKLIATARLIDRFYNEVPIFTDSSNILNLVKLDGPGELYVRGEFVENHNKLKIHFGFDQTGQYNLCLSDGNKLEHTSFSVTVRDPPLDYNLSSVKWLPQYGDMKDQPVFPEDESFQCCLKLQDVVGYNYDGEIRSVTIQMKYNNTEVKNIAISSFSGESGSYNFVVPLNNHVEHGTRPTFWCFVNGKKLTKPLVLPSFEVFEKYADDSVKIKKPSCKFIQIVCNGIERKELIGEDFCHLNNIKRICELNEDPKCDDFYYDGGNHTKIEIPLHSTELPLHEINGKVVKLKTILLHLLRAMYYRKRAFELDKAREKWKKKASETYQKLGTGTLGINEDLPHFCSLIKEKYAKLMKRYHNEACEEFFQFFNAGRCQSEIDLHGLLVVDENKLREYKQQLLSRRNMSPTEVKKKIRQEREHGNEAIRKVQEKLKKYNMEVAKRDKEPWLEIIVGAGRHSKFERQRIRPKIEKYLRKQNLSYSPVNKGALVVTFQKYEGSEPCFGEYYCTKCHNKWRNNRSWIDKWQACYICYEKSEFVQKCYPLKQRSQRKQRSYNPRINSRNRRQIPEHLEKLCEKCSELGRPCPQAY